MSEDEDVDCCSGVTETTCPKCGTPLNAATYAGTVTDEGGKFVEAEAKARPKPGQAAICWHCGAVNVFDAGGTMRAMTRSERRAMPSSVRRHLEHLEAMRVMVRSRN